MKKQRMIWSVTAMIMIPVFLIMLAIDRPGEERGYEERKGAGSEPDGGLSGSQDTAVEEGSVSGEGDSQDYSLKIVEMDQQERDGVLKKLFSYMESCRAVY